MIPSRSMLSLLLLSLFVAACGEDEVPPPPPPPPRPAGGGPAAPKKGPPLKKGQIKPMVRIEERVTCPIPSDAKKCDLKAPKCGNGEYCVPAGNAAYCGPCPERDAIRHVFKPRDFQGVDLRDPFQSFVINQPGLGGNEGKPTEVTPKCTRKDQFVALSYGYQSLKIVGIVSQGTQRKALMMGGNMGYIIKKGDCVGKEKAYVKDIGAGFITFAVESAGKTDSMEYSMQLYPTPINMGTPDAIDPGAASAPMVAPPPGVAPPDDRPSSTTRTTVITQPPTETVAPPPPSQPPTQLKP